MIIIVVLEIRNWLVVLEESISALKFENLDNPNMSSPRKCQLSNNYSRQKNRAFLLLLRFLNIFKAVDVLGMYPLQARRKVWKSGGGW